MEYINVKETNLGIDENALSERPFTDLIVIHQVGGVNRDFSAEEINRWHKEQGWVGIGYHFIIRKDGTVEAGRPEWAIGAHAYGFNSHSIGINVAGTFDIEAPTDKQIEAVSQLVANVASDYDIPITPSSVVGHRDLMSTDCPGDVLYSMLDTIRGKALWYQQN